MEEINAVKNVIQDDEISNLSSVGQTKYDKIIKPNFEKIKEMISEGTPEYLIQQQLKVSRNYWIECKKKYNEFRELINEANIRQLQSVEGFLYRKCKGYIVEDIKTYIEVDDNGKEKKRIEKFKKNIPSSDSAIQFYLKNKDSENWKDRQEFKQDITQKIQNLVIDIEDDEEIEEKK